MRFSSGRLAISDAKVVEVDGRMFNLIITALCLTTVFLPGSSIWLVESESVWTEIPGLSDSRKLEPPCPSGFLYKPPSSPGFSPQRFSRYIYPS